MPVQAKPELIEYRNRLKFSTVFQYTVASHSMHDVETANYFHSLSSNYLRAGDEMHVCVRDLAAGGWHKAIFEVTKVTPTETSVSKISEWRGTGQQISEPEPEVVNSAPEGVSPPQKPAKRVSPPKAA